MQDDPRAVETLREFLSAFARARNLDAENLGGQAARHLHDILSMCPFNDGATWRHARAYLTMLDEEKSP